MKNYPSKVILITTLSIMLVTGLGCGMNSKRLRTIGAVIAVGVAAKLLYDMYVDYKTEQVTNQDKVIEDYKKIHQQLPPEPALVTYESSLKPGEVVKAGSPISIISRLEVVPGTQRKSVEIQEKIVIYDNEDHAKELKSLTKPVNAETKTCGAFKNQFTFKLPKGMPQGIYPIKTYVIIDGKEFEPKQNQMQLVIHQQPNSENRYLAYRADQAKVAFLLE
ncbi:hypothetical protein ACUR5C_04800 [Aliikangiella sp. IMCC44653]